MSDRKRVFYQEGETPAWVEAAQLLQARLGWDPVLWAASLPDGGEHHQLVARTFPDSVFVNSFDLNRGIWPAALAQVPDAVLDAPLLGSFSEAETVCLRMMDRMDHDRRSFPFDDRVALFHQLLRRVLATYDHLRPDVVVFPAIPHVPADYLFYVVAQRRGIHTIIFQRSWSPVRLYTMESFEVGCQPLYAAYADLLARGEPAVLSDGAREHLRAMRASREAAKELVENEFIGPAFSRHVPVVRTLAGRAYRTLRSARRPAAAFRLRPDTYMKGRLRPVDRPPTHAELTVQRWRGNLAKWRLRRHYDELARPAVSGDYVFVPLHFQPELTTSPQGGEFVDQEHVVRLMASTVPAGWRVVVKEHFQTFMADYQGHIARSREFYSRLAAIANVQLVPADDESLPLIDGARALVTVSGTTGWEAVLRGVPALVFGVPWYRGCEGVSDVRTVDDVRAALASVIAGVRPDPARVDLFVEALESVDHEIAFTIYYDYLRDPAAVRNEGATRADALETASLRWTDD